MGAEVVECGSMENGYGQYATDMALNTGAHYVPNGIVVATDGHHAVPYLALPLKLRVRKAHWPRLIPH